MPIYFVLLPVLFTGAALFIWMTLIEPRRFRVWRVGLPFRERSEESEELALDAGRLPELRVIHITDTHFDGRDRGKLGFLRAVFESVPDPDFVFLTGDILDMPRGLESCFELAEMINAKLGAYAVLGGHDYFRFYELWRKYLSIYKNTPSPSRRKRPNPVVQLRRGLGERGVEVLEDENRIVSLPGDGRLAIVGLNDVFFFRCDYEKAWDGIGDMPAIVLAHSPDVLPQVVARGADMAFFGHTHGGQVRLPYRGAIVTRSMVGACRARGVFREGKSIFTINQGLGAARGTHIRLLCPPEITMMHLGAEDYGQDYSRVQFRRPKTGPATSAAIQ